MIATLTNKRRLPVCFTTTFALLGASLAFAPLTPVRADDAAPAAPAAFALIGTGSYPGGSLAVFDGNRAEFKTFVHTGEKIGDCTVAAIAFDHVRLKTPAGEIELPMEKQLRREISGAWQVADLAAPFTPWEIAPAPATATVPAARAVFAAATPVKIAAPSKSKAPRVEREPSEKELAKIDKKLIEAVKLGDEFKKFISGQTAKPSKRVVKALGGGL
ncbi:MAG TPA: hypothetical protein VI454_20335 [Verrucomicrobiae bacterium]|jgi:hypothetical protein